MSEETSFHPYRDVIAYSIIEGSAGIRAAEHAKDFQTANWTDALRSADSVIACLASSSGEPASVAGEADPLEVGFWKEKAEHAERERDVWKERAMGLRLSKPAPVEAGALQAIRDIVGKIPISEFPGKSYRQKQDNAEKVCDTLAALSQPGRGESGGWLPIETAPEVKGKYFFCDLAWGPDWDKCTGKGFRWNGRWFAAAVFYNNALSGECQTEFRQIEVQPTHWMPHPSTPSSKER